MSMQGKTAMAAFINDGLEPATRTLDGVRLVFHYCNFINLTLGAVAFGVGIGYDLTAINVSGDSYLKPVETKFLVVGLFLILHGLIGIYGFVSKQSRSLILYGCMGLCLLVVGSMASGAAVNGRNTIPEKSRDHFYHGYQEFFERIDTTNKTATIAKVKDGLEENYTATEDDQFIWDIMYVEKLCRMPDNITEDLPLNRTTDASEEELELETTMLNKYEESHVEFTVCDGGECKTYDKPILCLVYVRILARNRIVTMYVTLFLLATTQSVCLICDILFIFWSLKEEADIERHKSAKEEEKEECSSKLEVLARACPCFFRHQDFNQNNRREVPLCDISDADDPDQFELSSSQRSGSNSNFKERGV